MERIKELSRSEDAPGLYTENIEILYSDSAIVRFKLNAPIMVKFDQDPKDPFTEFPNGINIKRYNTEMEVTTNITADYARQFTNEDKWLARNNVVVVNIQGDSLRTEELYWDQKKEKIYTEKFVTIITKDRIINGIGMHSDQEMNNIAVINITGIIYLEVEE